MTVSLAGEIGVSVGDGVTTITLNRPPLNVLNIAFMRQLEKVLEDPATLSNARVVAIAAEGKAFCAGVDIADHTSERTPEMLSIFHALTRLLHELIVPTVAIVHGAALGGGFELALACDLILASEKAKFAVPEITLGVFPPVAMVHLPRAIGAKKASELIYTGVTLTAAEAERLGLVNAVYPAEEFASATGEFLKKFTRLSQASLIQTKRAFLESSAHQEPSEALKVAENRYLKQLMATHDAKEGIAAFMAKREPVWSHH